MQMITRSMKLRYTNTTKHEVYCVRLAKACAPTNTGRREDTDVGEEIRVRDAITGLDELILSLGQRILTYFASRSADFTIKEMFLIDVLGSREFATMSELAQILSVPLTTMTSMVTRLVNKGYLDRSRTEEDRRVVLVSLSSQGQEIFRQHRHEYVRTVSEILGDLAEEDQKTILGFIGQVLTAISCTRSPVSNATYCRDAGCDDANDCDAGCGGGD